MVTFFNDKETEKIVKENEKLCLDFCFNSNIKHNLAISFVYVEYL